MPTKNAHKILDIYAHFEAGPGSVLVSDQFLAIGRRRQWSPAELQDGIEEALSAGWIESGRPNEPGWRLTKVGYEESVKSPA